MTVKREPQKVSRTNAKDAWWYENKGSIDVIVQTEIGMFSVRIRRKRLADWIKRTDSDGGSG